MAVQTLPIPFSSYSETAYGAAIQSRVNMYPNTGRGGLRQFPALLALSGGGGTPSHTSGQSVQLSPGGWGGLAFNGDGTKMYLMAWSTDILYEVALSTAYDPSTRASNPPVITFTLTHTPTSPFSITWGDSGTKFYVKDSGIIYQYTAGTAYDITSLSYASKSFDTTTQVAASGADFHISPDGTRLFVVGDEAGAGTNNYVFSYTMASAWDMATVSYDSISLLVETQAAVAVCVTMNPDGTKIFVTGSTSDTFFQYNMTSAFNVSTGVLQTNEYDYSAVATTSQRQIMFNDNGTKLFLQAGNRTEVFSVATYSLGAENDSVGRGAINMDGVLYAVIGTGFYSVASTGALTTLGEVTGSARVDMETDGAQLVICTGAVIYKYTTAAGLVENADVDLDETAKTSAYGDLRFHYQQPNGQFIVSALNDATDVNALDFATAESLADDLVATHFHNQLLYLMGSFFSAVWKTTGTGRPPLRRQQVIERGILNEFCISSIDNNIYFIDNVRRLNVMSGQQYQPVDMGGLRKEIDSYADVSDAYLMTYSHENENFVEVSFPTEGVTWSLHEPTGSWSSRDASGQFRAAQYVNVYGKTLVIDRSNAKVYELSDATYLDDAAAITRTVDSALIDTSILGNPSKKVGLAPSQRMGISRIRLRYRCSGPTTLTVSMSKDDDIETFKMSRTVSLDGSGVVSLSRWGVAREFIVRVSTTSNTSFQLVDLAADISAQSDVDGT